MLPTKSISRFKGLNNVTDPLRLGMTWLAQADNVDITDSGAIRKRTGYSKTMSGSITGAYSSIDFSRMYVVDGGALKAMAGASSAVSLLSGLGTEPMHFTEINDQVFFNNGTDRGIIATDNTVHDWGWATPSAPSVVAVTGSLPAGTYQVRCTTVLEDGRETGAGDSAIVILGEEQALQISGVAGFNVYIAPADSTVYQLARAAAPNDAFVWNSSPDELGPALMNNFLDPLPVYTDVIQAWKGRIYAAQYMPTENQTAIWFSEPLAFHLFNLNSNFILVPGHVVMLAPHDDALIIGTTTRVFAYDSKSMSELAPYGVVPGWHWSRDERSPDEDRSSSDEKRILFWTTRGLCSALPFSNLTEKTVSVAPGVSAGGCVVHDGGQKRYLVALHRGGNAFNPYV